MDDRRKQWLLRQAKELGALDAILISPDTIVVSEWVRWKCQYGCRAYGSRLSCPPFSPAPQQTQRLLQGYQVALLIHGEKAFAIRYILSQLEREAFLEGYHKAFGMGAGPCRLCETCDTRGTCQHPAEARPSMEACGIDVFQTVRHHGFEVQVLKSPRTPGNFFGLLLLE